MENIGHDVFPHENAEIDFSLAPRAEKRFVFGARVGVSRLGKSTTLQFRLCTTSAEIKIEKPTPNDTRNIPI